MTCSTTLGVALALLVPTAALAQQVDHSIYVPTENRIHWPVVLGQGTFGRAVAGNLTGAQAASVVHLHPQGAPVLMFAPGVHATSFALSASATDVAILRGGGSGGRDALALVGSQGLDRLVYVPADGAFVSTELANGAWLGAVHVRSADLDASGSQDLVGVASDRRTILYLLSDGQGGWSSPAGFSVADDILDLEPLGWSGTASAELAVLSTWGLSVRSQSGTELDVLRSYQQDGSIAVLRSPAGPSAQQDRVAVAMKGASGNTPYLHVLRVGAADPEIDLGALGIYAVAGLAAGDRDGDGDGDLALSFTSNHRLKLFENYSDGSATAVAFPSPATPETYVIGSAGVIQSGAARPVLSDLDGDGLADLLCAVQDAGFAVIFAGDPLVLQDPLYSGQTVGDETQAHPAFQEAEFLIDDNLLNRLRLSVRNAWEASSSATNLYLEVIVWKQGPTDPYPFEEAVHHWMYGPLAPGAWTQQTANLDVTFDLVDCDEGALTFGHRYFVEARPVVADPQTLAITQTWRSYIGGATGDFEGTLDSFQALTLMPGAWGLGIPYSINGTEDPSHIGGYVPQTRVPPFDPAAIPLIKAAQQKNPG